MKRSVIAIALALVYLASAAKPVSADPIQHFSTFSITCAGTVFEIVSKPGSSNVVTVNGVPAFQLAPLEEEDDLIDQLLEYNPKFRRLLQARLRERKISAKEAARRL